MHVKIQAGEPDNKGFMPGSFARLWLNGEEVSQWVTRVVVDVAAADAIMATVEFGVSGLELDVPAVIQMAKEEAGKSAE